MTGAEAPTPNRLTLSTICKAGATAIRTALRGAFSRKQMKNQRDDGKNQQEMNEEAGDMVEEEAANPDAEEQDG